MITTISSSDFIGLPNTVRRIYSFQEQAMKGLEYMDIFIIIIKKNNFRSRQLQNAAVITTEPQRFKVFISD